jgi:hypothetical protein
MTNATSLILSVIMPHSPINTSVGEEAAPQRTFSTPRRLQFDVESHEQDDENSRNALNTPKERKGFLRRSISKRRQTFSAAQVGKPQTSVRPTTARKPQPLLQASHSSDSSEAESDVSVSKLKGWLDDFGKKNKSHFENGQIGQTPAGVKLEKPTRAKMQVKQQPQPISIKRPADQKKESRRGPTMTPVRFNARCDKDAVKATDSGYATVKQLSAWLADDPTSTKSKRGCVRRGINVIKKSRAFEKDLEDVIVEEVGMHRGEVNQKRDWLAHAFEGRGHADTESDHQSAVTELVSVQDKKKWLSGAFQKEPERVSGGSALDIPDDRSYLSVTDKRTWLQTAFKKGSERMLDDKQSDGHDFATPAKLKWKAASVERRRSVTSVTTVAKPPTPVNAAQPQDVDHAFSNVDSEATLDFKAARQLLVQRSEVNGNPLSDMTKVQMRKNKFERWEKDLRKGSGPNGLLKQHWAQGDGVESSSTGYSKTFVQDIAPKKSFEELP